MRTKTVFSLLLVTVWAAVAAQDQPPPVFRARTELVRLDVRVTDREGRPIKDLRPEEIEIVERGQRRPVLLFHHMAETGRSFAEAAAESMASEVSSNTAAPRGHLYVLVFDQLHITSGAEQRVRRAAERFLEKPGDRIAVFGVPGPGPTQGFTSDISRARLALQSVRGRSTRGSRTGTSGDSMRTYEAYQVHRGDNNTAFRVLARSPADPAISGLAGSIVGGGDDPSAQLTILREEAARIVAQADMESRLFLSLLSDVMKPMKSIEGRKAVIVFSEGFFIDNVARDLETVAAAAAESYSVVYGIDLNSFDPGPEQERPEPNAQLLAEIVERRDPLATLATETDGRLVSNATNFEQILTNIAAEAGDYYLVGFEPVDRDKSKEGDYRRVQVNVRREAVQVRARTGYVVAGERNPATRRQTIDEALASPFAMTALSIEYTTYVLRGSTANRPRVIMSLSANLPAGTDPNQEADVVFVARETRTGATVASGTDRLKLPESTAVPAGGTAAVPYRIQFEAPPGDYLMRVVVREPGGLIGTADRRFRVRALDGPALSASDLVLAPANAQSLDPPHRAVVRADQGLTAYLELYGSPTALETAAVSIEVARADGGEPVEARQLLADHPAGGRVVRAPLPIQRLTPGSYIARARVAAGPGPATTLTRHFEVLPGASAARGSAAATGFDATSVLKSPAVGDYKQRLEQDRGDHAALARSGLVSYERGDHKTAATQFEKLVELAPKDPWPPFMLGASYAALGRDRDAIGAWRLAAVRDPHLLAAHLQLADAYLRLDEVQLAAQVLQSALIALPDSPELWERLGALKK